LTGKRGYCPQLSSAIEPRSVPTIRIVTRSTVAIARVTSIEDIFCVADAFMGMLPD
jgi:hypothetical protein